MHETLDYRDLFDLAHDAILVTSAETGKILVANNQAEVLFGYTPEELSNRYLRDLEHVEETNRMEEFERQLAARGCGCGMTADLPYRAADGRRLVLSVSCSMQQMSGIKAVIRVCRDVTREREMERQSQLMQAEKAAALARLVAGVAHALNTPLGSINSNNDILALSFHRMGDFIRAHPPADRVDAEKDLAVVLSVGEEAVQTIHQACARMVKIVGSLRNFVRLDEAERKMADVHEGIESSLTLVAHEMKGRVTVVEEFASIPEVECYPSQLNQVFMHLLLNAAQAIEGQGTIRIRTWCEDDTIRIAISDNGRGIPDELKSRVFEPGFTTRKPGLGTGLGLPICMNIVQKHGGRIDLQSEVGRGATFTIVLPIKPNTDAVFEGLGGTTEGG